MLPIFTFSRHLLATIAVLCMAMPMARAEGQIRIAGQHGITFLLLNIAQEQKLIEKHGKQQGVDVKVEWITLSGGPPSTMPCCPAISTLPAPAWGRC